MHKVARLFELCQTRADYRALWDRMVAMPTAPAKKKSRGLGDTIAKITKAIGIAPCKKCKKRQKKLNELFPYGS